jgi:hypothetical protein
MASVVAVAFRTASAGVAVGEVDGGRKGGMSVTQDIVQGIITERNLQDRQWGEQNHPDGTGRNKDGATAEYWRRLVARKVTDGSVTWRDILEEEVYEALAETDPSQLVGELLQVAAVAVAWIECIERRQAGKAG